jgi:hypothetical protein
VPTGLGFTCKQDRCTLGLDGDNLGAEVTEHLLGRPDVRLDDLEEHPVRLAGIIKLRDRNPDAFLEHLRCIRRPLTVADI